MVKVAVTGPDGLIGSRIFELLVNDFELIPLKQPEFDITKREIVQEKLKNIDFDLLLHLAAYTNVDEAEKNRDLVYKVNVNGTKNLLEIVQKKKKKMIYISTDFVFAGTNPPYFEDDKPNPVGYYAKTKYQGEQIVKNNAMIVRLSYPYRASFAKKKDFLRHVKHLLEQRESLQMVTDSMITPTFIDDIIYAFKHLLNNFSPETYHIVGTDSPSPYEAGMLIANTFNLDESLIQPTTYEKYFKNRAKRPQFSEIKSKKNNFSKMKSFEEGLNEVRKQLRI